MCILSLAAALLTTPAIARTKPQIQPQGPSAECVQAIGATERRAKLPPQLLATIALIESGRRDPVSGLARPWPWTINAEGTGFFFETKEQAIAAVQALQANGVRSIDVGCMQINLMHHATAFASLDEAFDPQANVAYGARFLNQLFSQSNDWPKAAAAYHSQTPDVGADYLRRVMALWPAGAQYGAPIAAESSAMLRSATSAPAQPKPYTSEFARMLARDAADRAALYAEMKMTPPQDARRQRSSAAAVASAGGAGAGTRLRTQAQAADRTRMIRMTAEAAQTMLPAESSLAAFKPARSAAATAGRRIDLARASE